MHTRFRRWLGLAALALILAAAMALAPRPAAAQMELTGNWTGVFEFITQATSGCADLTRPG